MRMNYLRYQCTLGHEPIMWSSVRNDTLAEHCHKCGMLTEPHIINELDDTEVLINARPLS